jgi:hypothetical protein
MNALRVWIFALLQPTRLRVLERRVLAARLAEGSLQAQR